MHTIIYLVKPGDTLSKIAENKLGSANKWRFLADINNLSNPGNLRVGQKLKIPAEFSHSPNIVNTSSGINPPIKEQIQIFTENKTVMEKLKLRQTGFV